MGRKTDAALLIAKDVLAQACSRGQNPTWGLVAERIEDLGGRGNPDRVSRNAARAASPESVWQIVRWETERTWGATVRPHWWHIEDLPETEPRLRLLRREPTLAEAVDWIHMRYRPARLSRERCAKGAYLYQAQEPGGSGQRRVFHVHKTTSLRARDISDIPLYPHQDNCWRPHGRQLEETRSTILVEARQNAPDRHSTPNHQEGPTR